MTKYTYQTVNSEFEIKAGLYKPASDKDMVPSAGEVNKSPRHYLGFV